MRTASVALAAALALALPAALRAAPADFTAAVLSMKDASEGVDCAWELALSDLSKGVGVAGRKVPCLARVNVSSAGAETTHAGPNSVNPVLSADGRFVAFLSRAANLVADDTNNADDVFVFDRAAETAIRASVTSADAQAGGPNLNPWLSADGRHLLWRADGSGLPGGGIRVVGRDRDADEDGILDEPGAVSTTLVGSSGGGPRASPDGRFVVLTTGGSVTGAGSDSNGANDVYLVDRDFDEDGVFDEGGAGYKALRASVTAAGAQGSGTSETNALLTASTGASSGTPSADGRWIAFSARFTNLVAEDANGKLDVFVRDRDANGNGVLDEPGDGTTFAISVAAGGATSDGVSGRAFMSPDGRWIAYSSDATNLPGVGDSGGFLQVILHDRDADEDGVLDEPGFTSNRRISRTADGAPGDGDSVAYLSVSPGGRWIAYDSTATNLVPEDGNATRDVYLHDRDADGDGIFDEPGGAATVLVSRNAQTGAVGNGPSFLPHVVDGPLVSFASEASNLLGDANGAEDGFVWDGDAASAP